MVDCSKTENYFKEKARMTKVDEVKCNTSCLDCPIGFANNGRAVTCLRLEVLYPQTAIEIVQKWSDEHPRMTMKGKFFELFPDAPKHEETGNPLCCPMHLGWDEHECIFNSKCSKCWNRPYEE